MSHRLGVTILAALIGAGLWQPAEAREKKPDEPDRITVQHLLIGFKQTLPGKVTRSKKEARTLADSLFERAKDGEDFDALVKEYTDDRYPGIYTLTNYGTSAKAREHDRDAMVPAFGDVAFSLEVGEVGLVAFHAALSPYGYHVIRRIE